MAEGNKTWRDFAIGGAALAAMTAFGLTALVVITWILARFLGDTVSAAIVAGAAPLVATFSFGIWNDYRAAARSRELEQLRRRGDAYREFLAFLYDSIRRLDDESQPNDFALEPDEYGVFVQDILTWGSDELIELWNEFRHVDLQELDREAQRRWYARLLDQIREELRGTSSDLPAEELYDLYSVEGDELGDATSSSPA